MTAVLHRSLSARLPTAVGGEGCYIIDAEGRRYFDGSGGAAVACLGHGHPAVVEAVKRALDGIAFAHSGFFTNEAAERLAQHLIDRAPAGFGQGAVMYLGSGSEGMEAALKLVRQHWTERGEDRHRIIARDMAYHGNTLGALAAGGHPVRRARYAPMLMEVGRVPAIYPYRHKRDDESLEAYGQRMAQALEDAILASPEPVAAFGAETVGGATLGCVPPPPGYFAAVREICDRHGVLLLADEVMCGMGRTGSLFAMEAEGVCPDLIVIAKGLAAGYQPLAAVLASEKVMAPLRQGSGALANGHTYMNHAIACAAGLATLETFERDGLIGRARVLGAHLEGALRDAFGQHPHAGDIRGRGLFWAVEIVEDRDSKAPFDPARQIAPRLKAEAMARGLICYPAQGCADGRAGDHLLLAPPFIATEDQLTQAVATARDALDAALR